MWCSGRGDSRKLSEGLKESVASIDEVIMFPDMLVDCSGFMEWVRHLVEDSVDGKDED